MILRIYDIPFGKTWVCIVVVELIRAADWPGVAIINLVWPGIVLSNAPYWKIWFKYYSAPKYKIIHTADQSSNLFDSLTLCLY